MGCLQQTRAHPSFRVELCLVIGYVLEYSEDFKKCQDVLLYLQFLMLLVFVPSSAGTALPQHISEITVCAPISNAAV